MDNDRKDKRAEQSKEQGQGQVKMVTLDKLHDERNFWIKKIEAERDQHDRALSEVKQAVNALLSTIVRTYGEETDEGIYTLLLPIPEKGYVTAGTKLKNEYLLKTMKL